MKLNILLSSVILIAFGACQSSKKIIGNAEKTYENENYCTAIEASTKAYNSITRKGEAALANKGKYAFQTAESFRLTNRPKEAGEWYEKAKILKYQLTDPSILFQLGEMYRLQSEYDKAIEAYKKYAELVPGDKQAEVQISSCTSVGDYKANPTKHIVSNIDALNDVVMDMAPMFSDRKDSRIIFGSSRTGSSDGGVDPRTCENYMDLWEAQINKNGTWSAPVLLNGDKINTDANEGTASFDERAKTMFFTRCPKVNKKDLGCEIWRSELNGKTWGAPEMLKLKSDGADTVSVGHPCTSADGKFLIFTSDMTGGFGGRDLWYTTYIKKGNSWSAPINMGSEINTSGDEMFATFSRNGDLLFSSNGLSGMGGLDIFKATKVGDEMKWENPVNMGAPLNSNNNDYNLVEKDDKNGYFTSERKGVKGDNNKPDLYQYVIPPNLYDLTVIATNVGTKEKIEGATVKVTGADGKTFEGITNADGSVSWDKQPNGDRYVIEEGSYTIKLSKEGFHEDTKGASFTTVGLDYPQSFVIDMSLLPKGVIRLPEVRYALGSAVLLVDSTINSKDSLNFVFNLLTEYPGMVLELSSHTDTRGADAKNMALSIARAKSCVDYLVKEKGVDPKRLVPVGKGETVPQKWRDPATGEILIMTDALIVPLKKSNPKLFEFYHSKNRRTEGRVITMDYVEAPKSIETLL
jgi:peptidoglycan-associated lipoprotein